MAPNNLDAALQILSLDISTNPDTDTIKHHYKILSRKYHPDNSQTGDEKKFIAIQKAFQYIKSNGIYKIDIHNITKIERNIFRHDTTLKKKIKKPKNVTRAPRVVCPIKYEPQITSSGIIYHGDNLEVLKTIPSGFVDLIYIDPPFNTGKIQKRVNVKTGTKSYHDQFDDYMDFLKVRIIEAYRILKSNGSLYFHIDHHEGHYCKIMLDEIFGRKSFLNEIIWAYDYGGRSKKKWPNKHDNIFWYAKNPNNYIFNYEDIERIPYMAPGLVGPEKAAKGKTPTDVWWHTIVPTNGTEKTGYPTQKPLGIIRRIIRASTTNNSIVMDFFAGSGTFGVAAIEMNRNFILIDNNTEAIEVMSKRFANVENIEWIEWNNTEESDG